MSPREDERWRARPTRTILRGSHMPKRPTRSRSYLRERWRRISNLAFYLRGQAQLPQQCCCKLRSTRRVWRSIMCFNRQRAGYAQRDRSWPTRPRFPIRFRTERISDAKELCMEHRVTELRLLVAAFLLSAVARAAHPVVG